MTWGTATVALVIAAGVNLIVMEILRSIADRKRKQKYGVGGTQDIAMWGVLIGYLLIIGALVCGSLWLINR
jgi:hypothetical protein